MYSSSGILTGPWSVDYNVGGVIVLDGVVKVRVFVPMEVCNSGGGC